MTIPARSGYTDHMRSNYHTHCDFCDGRATAAQMAEAALAAGYGTLGFSSHAPLPFPTSWNMDPARLPAYLDALRGLAQAYEGRLTVLAGLEIDFIDGLCGPADDRFSSLGLDYSLGSVHYVLPKGAPEPRADALDARGEPTFGFTVDEPEADFAAHLEAFYGGDAEALVEDYYTALIACVGRGGFDILGHLDLIRKNNRGQAFFNEGSPRYREAAMGAVDALRGSGVIVEVNTGGMARGKTDTPYPAGWILKELRARGVDICVCADAHEPGHLGALREAGLRAAHEAGYRRLARLGREGRSYEELA